METFGLFPEATEGRNEQKKNAVHSIVNAMK